MGKSVCKCFYRFVWFYSSQQLEYPRESFSSLGLADLDLSDAEAVFDKVDHMLEGSDADKEKALRILRDAASQVCAWFN